MRLMRACAMRRSKQPAEQHPGTDDVVRVFRGALRFLRAVEPLDRLAEERRARRAAASAWRHGRSGGRLGRLLRGGRGAAWRSSATVASCCGLGIQRGLEHPHVGAAAADVAVERLARLRGRWLAGSSRAARRPTVTKPGVQKPHIRPSLSQNACCTGCSTVPCVKLSTVRIALALRLDRQHRAGIDGLAIDNHRACAAGAPVAHALGAGDDSGGCAWRRAASPAARPRACAPRPLMLS